jgi:hypothetical protein
MKTEAPGTSAVANWRRLVIMPPWAWLTIEGIATVAWLCAIAWGGFKTIRWLFS